MNTSAPLGHPVVLEEARIVSEEPHKGIYVVEMLHDETSHHYPRN